MKTNSEKKNPTNKVIVIGCSLTGYAVLRALSDKDIYLIAMSYSGRDVAQFSRYASEVVHSPDPSDEERFVSFLIENASRWKGALLLETADIPAVVLSKNKVLLSQYYKVATPDWEALRTFVEKEKTYALAQKLNIPHPKSISLIGRKDVTGVSGILYPCILKPVNSSEFTSRFNVKNFEVNSDHELREKFRICLDAGHSMILQEIIPGPDENLYKMQGYVNSQGKLVGRFFYRKLRQNPPQFGMARVGISTDRYPEVERLTAELLAHTNYTGYFSNEFKLDSRDGQLKLIENNCRMPRSGMLAIASGVNFPWLIYQDLVLNQQTDITHYTVGMYWIDLWSDVINVVFRNRDEKVRLNEYIVPYLSRNKVFADLQLRDPKPFIGAIFTSMKSFWQRNRKPKNKGLDNQRREPRMRT